MIETLYIEADVLDKPRTQKIMQRFTKAQTIVVDRYSEIFNSHTQNFRLQKSKPALILAEKKNQRVHSTPMQYETGGGANYYFSHMLNCLYDCRYCFLQGMYRSANYLLFVNYEDFIEDIAETAEAHRTDTQAPWFFSGYDCDSLAMEPVTGFADYFLSEFATLPHATLELRSKSTQIRSLLDRPALDNVVVAFSLSPQSVVTAVEAGTPSLEKRLAAMQKLQAAGWRIGVRFDPLIWHHDWQTSYTDLIQAVFSSLNADAIDSVTLGGFRLPKGYFKTMRKLYPDHWLFGSGLTQENGMIVYQQQIEAEMLDYVAHKLKPHVDDSKLFIYPSYDAGLTSVA